MIARIKERAEVAKGTLQVTFDLAPATVSFKAGQFFTLTLPNPPYTDERGNRRFFSIANSPNQNDMFVIATRVRDTAFKRSLREMPLGSDVEIGPIAGRLVLPADLSRPLAFIAGGIGIVPFISMIRWAAEEHLPANITLLYANRNREVAAYLDELGATPGLRLITTMDGDPAWPGEKRIITAQFIKDYVADPQACRWMIAGPPGMSEALSAALQEAGVDKHNIQIERFIGY